MLKLTYKSSRNWLERDITKGKKKMKRKFSKAQLIMTGVIVSNAGIYSLIQKITVIDI